MPTRAGRSGCGAPGPRTCAASRSTRATSFPRKCRRKQRTNWDASSKRDLEGPGAQAVAPSKLRLAQPIQQRCQDRRLTLQNFLLCLGVLKPCNPIDLGELLRAARLRGPFHRELIAFEFAEVEVAFDGPGHDRLAAGLPEASKRDEFAFRNAARLLLKFAAGGCKRLFSVFVETLGNGPGAVILLGPERAAGGRTQKLRPGGRPAKHQNACAPLGHHGHAGGYRANVSPRTLQRGSRYGFFPLST